MSAEWFGAYEVSIFGGKNSLDLQNIDRDDRSYDIVICNHVLEHVHDDIQAFREMVRVLRPNGFIQITVPDPSHRKTTDDWGFPDSNLHGHFRHYGIDLIQRFNNIDSATKMFYIDLEDPVTGTNDYIFFYSRSTNCLERLIRSFKDNFTILHSPQ